MLSEEKSGCAGMFTPSCALPISSLVSPDISVPNSKATGWVAASCNTCGIASRGVFTAMEMSRRRAVIATVNTTPCKRFVDGAAHHGVLQDIVRPGGHRSGLRIGEMARVD